MSEKFDPTKHLRPLKGKGGVAEYLDVKWRLVWLRNEHPDATTGVEHIEISPDIAIFKATVSIPGGGSATDYGSETPRDFGDYIEKAATKALGRALAQLGYGTQFVGFELDENTRIVDSPVDRHPQQRDPDDDLPEYVPARATSAPQSNATAPARVPTPPAAQHGAQAAPDLDANLLARIRDDQAAPEFRQKALHNYYMRAATQDDLARRSGAVRDAGLPLDDLNRALDWHLARLRDQPTPAEVR